MILGSFFECLEESPFSSSPRFSAETRLLKESGRPVTEMGPKFVFHPGGGIGARFCTSLQSPSKVCFSTRLLFSMLWGTPKNRHTVPKKLPKSRPNRLQNPPKIVPKQRSSSYARNSCRECPISYSTTAAQAHSVPLFTR